MTLAQVITKMKEIAAQQPAVSLIIDNDIYRLNATPDATYGVFAYTQGQHTGNVDGSLHRFAFTLFYVDRLNEDHSNEIEVQSVGVQVLETILRAMSDAGIFAGDYSVNTFTQRFLDDCAGAFASTTFEVPFDTLCVDDYEQISNDTER